MARREETKPAWVAEFWRNYRPPTESELKRRRKLLDRAWKNREKLNIAPLTTTDLVRAVREGDPD